MKPDTNQPKITKQKPDAKDDLKSLPLPEVEKKLGSSPAAFSQAEAQKRLTQYRPNEIEEKKTNSFLMFLSYLWGPIPWMIEAAVILSALDRHWPVFGIILTLLLANAGAGFWEEHQAGNATAALKAKLAVKTQVKRDGKWTNPEARNLVPGNVIHLRPGDIVPADARLLEGEPVEVDKSVLTGESLPASRKPERGGVFLFDPPREEATTTITSARDGRKGQDGYGVNDVPALKKADCGIAVSGATDAARAAHSGPYVPRGYYGWPCTVRKSWRRCLRFMGCS